MDSGAEFTESGSPPDELANGSANGVAESIESVAQFTRLAGESMNGARESVDCRAQSSKAEAESINDSGIAGRNSPPSPHAAP
jgi:hypothetical protein